MHEGGIAVTALIGGVIIICAAWAFIVYGPELRRVPYLWENITAPSATSPQAAYDGFYQALGDKNWQGALAYISRENRERYRAVLADPETRRRQLTDKSQLRELQTTTCDKGEVCRREALYEYDYGVKEGFWEEVAGKRFYVPAGTQRLEMSFIELPSGRWQITEL